MAHLVEMLPNGEGIKVTFDHSAYVDTVFFHTAESYAEGGEPVRKVSINSMQPPPLTVYAGELGEEKIEGLWVVETCQNLTCEKHILADLAPYRDCLLAMALRTRVDGCKVVVDWDCYGCGHSLPYVGVLLQALEIAVEKGMARASARLASALEGICGCCADKGKCLDCL